MNRRQFLKGLGASIVLGALATTAAASVINVVTKDLPKPEVGYVQNIAIILDEAFKRNNFF